MKLTRVWTFLAVLLPVVFASSSLDTFGPRQDDSTDYNSRVLTFALSLEQMVNTFYHTSLAKFSAEDFRAAGHNERVRKGYERISASVQAHVDWLEKEMIALGSVDATGSCEYGFPVDTMDQFVDLSEAFQALAVSTYTGAMHKVHTEKYITAFAAMLGAQSRYATWIDTAVKHRGLSDVAFEAPGSMNTTWSAAGPYVTSCPPGTNPDAILPHGLVNFPYLTLSSKHINPGQSLHFDFNITSTDDLVVIAPGNKLFAAFEVGLDLTAVEISGSAKAGYSVVVPAALKDEGAVWMYIVQCKSADGVSLRDKNIVAGPAFMMFGKNGMRRKGEQNVWAW